MLDRYACGELTVGQASDPERVYPTDDVERRRQEFGVFRRPISEVLDYEEVDGVIARIRVRDDRGRPMIVRVQQHPDHPGRVWTSNMMLDPPGVTVRLARPEDAEALRSLELATPVQHDAFEVAYDRPDPFAQDRLRPLRVFRSVAESDGAVVGTHADAWHVLVMDTGSFPVIYRHHTRIHPAYQGSGVWPAINGSHSEWVRRDGTSRGRLTFTAIGNDKMLALKSGGSGAQRESAWVTPIVRYLFDCAALSKRTQWPPGRAADEEHVSNLLHNANARCVFWPRAGRTWLAQRMNRSPDYRWNDLVVGEHAVIGVWDAGWTVVRTNEVDTTRRRVATILDWALDPDHPEALEESLRAACTRAMRSGITHLFAFCGPPAPGHTVLNALATEAEHFELNTTLAEPPDTADRGIYIDPIYF